MTACGCSSPAVTPRSAARRRSPSRCGRSAASRRRPWRAPSSSPRRRSPSASCAPSARSAMPASPTACPMPAELPARLGEVLSVLYLIFNEGYLASSGDVAERRELARDAEWLTSLVARLMPDEPEVLGLLALMRLHLARADARFGRRRLDRAAAGTRTVGAGTAPRSREAVELLRRAERDGPAGHLPAPGRDPRRPRRRADLGGDAVGRDRAALRRALPPRADPGGRAQPGAGPRRARWPGGRPRRARAAGRSARRLPPLPRRPRRAAAPAGPGR